MGNVEEILKTLTPNIIAWRRHLHAYPELGFEEYHTAEYITNILHEIGLKTERFAKTGVVANIGTDSGKCIAIRADMDALPLREETGLAFSSCNEGVMHACGHDAHVAILLGVASLLSKISMPNVNMKFIFQPSEEHLPSGAKQMLAEGVLQKPKVDAILGFHVYPYLPVGTVGIRKGVIMAATDTFSVEVQGKGGHGAAPHNSVDPIVTAAHMITALQTIVSRKVNPTEPAVVTVGTIHAGERPNVIPEKLVFTGTVRSISPSTRKFLEAEIIRILNSLAESAGAAVKVTYQHGHGPLINNEELTRFTKQVLDKTFGETTVHILDAPSMAGEDFSCFAEAIPANYIFFGAAGEKVHPWHHPCFTINEDVLPFAVKALATLVLQYLKASSK